MGSMRKEVTVGFSVIAVLLVILGVLIYRRAATMWQTPDANAQATTAPVTPIAAIDGQPRTVLAQDMQPGEQRLDEEGRDPSADSNGAEQPYGAPVARHEPPHSSFLPRQFDQAGNDPASSPPAEGEDLSGQQDPAFDSNSGAMPAETDSSSVAPTGGRQTSLEVTDGDLAGLDARRPLDADPSGTGLSDDPTAMVARRDEDGQEWPASAGAAEGLAVSGSRRDDSAPDAAYNQQGMPDQPAAAPAAAYGEFERREGFAGGREPERDFGRSRREPERVAVENGRYTVAPNDSYWIIAEKIYGNGAYYKALFEHNRARHPRSDKLHVGDVLDAPAASELAEHYPDLCPRPRKVPNARQTLQPASTRQQNGGRVYVVSEGDTLFDIARHELGKAARWTEIYDMNHDVLGEDFDYLRPGTELVLPRDRRDTDTVTRKDDPVYQR